VVPQILLERPSARLALIHAQGPGKRRRQLHQSILVPMIARCGLARSCSPVS
jgi:hypothetical protein